MIAVEVLFGVEPQLPLERRIERIRNRTEQSPGSGIAGRDRCPKAPDVATGRARQEPLDKTPGNASAACLRTYRDLPDEQRVRLSRRTVGGDPAHHLFTLLHEH